MWLKLSTTLKKMPLTHVCSHSSVRRWTQSTHVFSHTEKWDAFLKGDDWPEILSNESFLLEKQSPLAVHFSDTEWVTNLAYLCDIFSLLNELNMSLQGRTTTVFKLADKTAAFKAKLELRGQCVNIWIFDMFRTLEEILKETEPGLLSPSCCISAISAFKRVWGLLPNYKRSPNWEGLNLWPICE